MNFRRFGSQQEAEKFYFELFRQASGMGAIPEYGDKPDVIIHLDRKIGVEITNFYLRPGSDDASEQRQRERRTTIVADAQTPLEERGRNTLVLSGKLARDALVLCHKECESVKTGKAVAVA